MARRGSVQLWDEWPSTVASGSRVPLVHTEHSYCKISRQIRCVGEEIALFGECLAMISSVSREGRAVTGDSASLRDRVEVLERRVSELSRADGSEVALKDFPLERQLRRKLGEDGSRTAYIIRFPAGILASGDPPTRPNPGPTSAPLPISPRSCRPSGPRPSCCCAVFRRTHGTGAAWPAATSLPSEAWPGSSRATRCHHRKVLMERYLA